MMLFDTTVHETRHWNVFTKRDYKRSLQWRCGVLNICSNKWWIWITNLMNFSDNLTQVSHAPYNLSSTIHMWASIKPSILFHVQKFYCILQDQNNDPVNASNINILRPTLWHRTSSKKNEHQVALHDLRWAVSREWPRWRGGGGGGRSWRPPTHVWWHVGSDGGQFGEWLACRRGRRRRVMTRRGVVAWRCPVLQSEQTCDFVMWHNVYKL